MWAVSCSCARTGVATCWSTTFWATEPCSGELRAIALKALVCLWALPCVPFVGCSLPFGVPTPCGMHRAHVKAIGGSFSTAHTCWQGMPPSPPDAHTFFHLSMSFLATPPSCPCLSHAFNGFNDVLSGDRGFTACFGTPVLAEIQL